MRLEPLCELGCLWLTLEADYGSLKREVANPVKLLLTVFLLLAMAAQAFAQAREAANKNGSQFVVGAGASYFNSDWAGRLVGPTAWVGWNLFPRRSLLRGVELEVEARDLNYARQLPGLRQDTATGGVVYNWRFRRNFDAYGKFLVGRGSLDAEAFPHFARTINVPGGGIEYRLAGRVWLRGDFEYQFWPNMLRAHYLNPNGVTVGATYHFEHLF